jgi:hypothetical protein
MRPWTASHFSQTYIRLASRIKNRHPLCGHERRIYGIPFQLVLADAAETILCATLAATTLLGLVLFAAFSWWWADPIAALAVAYFAVREGREAWHGELVCDD